MIKRKQHGRNEPGKVTKGRASGLLISVLVHVGLFLLAGLFVVFVVPQKKEKKFVPPPAVERPKMQIKKPKVKPAKTSKPKPTQRIVTKMKKASMPSFDLPDIGGMGDGLGGVGIGDGFSGMPAVDSISLFGGGQTIGNDFVGTFYDFKRDRRGGATSYDPTSMCSALQKFVQSGFQNSRLAKYYRSPRKLYTTTFVTGMVPSSFAPLAFGEDTEGWCWAIHYNGQLVSHKDIRFRFWGFADDILLVAVNKEVVLNASWSWPSDSYGKYAIGGNWVVEDATDDFQYYYGPNWARVGDWIELKAGEPFEMDVIIGEVPGGEFYCMLTVQEDGVEYERNKQQQPILPIFKTEEPSHVLADTIYRTMFKDEASVTNGPIFRDYNFSVKRTPKEVPPTRVIAKDTEARSWQVGEREVRGEYIAKIGDQVVLRLENEKQVKVPYADLSQEDYEYIELSNPPRFDVDLVRSSDTQHLSSTPYLSGKDPARVNNITFSAKVKKLDSKPYDYPLRMEYYAFANEILGDALCLVDYKQEEFTLSKENNFQFRMTGNPVQFVEYTVSDWETRVSVLNGMRYGGKLVVLYDKFDRVVAYNASREWLFEYLDELKKLPVGAWFDNKLNRVHPTSPRTLKY